MKKNTIGFPHAESTAKTNCSKKDNEVDTDQDECPKKMPEEVVNQIEEHILAKHEYEQSMERLNKYDFYWNMSKKIIIGLILLGIGFCSGYLVRRAKAQCQAEQIRQQRRAYYNGCVRTYIKMNKMNRMK